MDFEKNESCKYCKYCGQKIPIDAVLCTNCGRQIEELKTNNQTQSVIINQIFEQNKKPRNKWLALFLCVVFGILGAHKFYEGKTGMGILYILTGGLFIFGVLFDFFSLLFKPNPYYV